MKAIVLLGAPGAGKGSAAEKIKERTRYQHVSTGDMLRDAIKCGSEVGLEAETYMKRGELVPDEIMIRLVEERMRSGGGDAAYMLDGFPRTDNQATLLDSALERMGGTLERVFFLYAPRELLITRLTGRRICRSCGANYHAVNIPPAVEGVCDNCGGELYQRSDDQEDTIVNRLEVYNEQTEGLIERYEKAGLLARIDSDCGVDAMVDVILEIL